MAAFIPAQGDKMRNADSFLRTASGAAMLVASLLAWPVTGAAQLTLPPLPIGGGGTTQTVNGTASAVLGNLTLDGVPVDVSGAPNQTIAFPGGQLVINEQTATAGGIVVNALHLVVYGIADVVLGSATAAVQ